MRKIAPQIRRIGLCLGLALLFGAVASAQDNPYYLRSTVGPPWNVSTNEAAMDAAFGPGNWVDERYETVDTATLLATPRFIFMEGGDDNADEMEAFLVANAAAINVFLNAGGVVLFNAAPNEGDGMGLPDGAGLGVALTYPGISNTATAAFPSHPIFMGPLPTTTAFTGGSFAHASVSGPGLTSLLDGMAGSELSSRRVGAGLALYGGMTTTNFHNPQPDADNLRANLLIYANSQVNRDRPYYLRSTVGPPWNASTNEAAMDAAFGGGNWVDERYETVDTAILFASPRFIFMEGSDDNADELEAFLAANLAAINAFLTGGGVVLFNAAPNEGDGMFFPDGVGQSVALTYPDFSVNPVATARPGHPIFGGPFPTATSFTGSSFGHALVAGTGLVSLLDDSTGDSYLAERSSGLGLALYGGMTTSNFHNPQPDANNLRANILVYAESQVNRTQPYYLRSTVGPPWNVANNEAAMDAAFGTGNWVDERYETVDTTTLFRTPRFIFMEGSDDNADELEAFLGANLAAINAFLNGGGVVFFNAAPNEGNGMFFPDGVGQTIALNYPTSQGLGPTSTASPGHEVFQGPYATSTAFTGNRFSHAFVTGVGITSLLDDELADSVLAERPIGLGLALYGGMTTSNFHNPQPDADNLRANILAYGLRNVRYAGPFYMRSTVGAPWNSLSNETAMNSIFGAGNWADARYETVGVDLLLSQPRFIFMEGGDDNADELEAFLGANVAAINTFLDAGGVIFFNAAPNEGNGMFFPDGVGQTIALNYPTSQGFGPTSTSVPGHPVFQTPNLLVSTAFTASRFSHAFLTGAGIASLLDDELAASVLAERPIGLGLALYGGMTTSNFHSPQPDADNLRANILAYGGETVRLPEPSTSLGLAFGVLALWLCARRRRA